MIRINLLPVKAAARRASGVRQVLIGAIVLTLGLVAVLVVHTLAMNDLTEQQNKIATLDASIAALKKQVGDYEKIKQQRDNLLRQKAAIQKLQEQRTGPAFLMREMSDVLTKGKGPTINQTQYQALLQADPNAGYNPNWEPKRAWIISYAEKDGQVEMKGGAKSDEDMAEFLKRLKLSEYFVKDSVYWKKTEPQVEAKLNNAPYVTFELKAKVNY